LQCLERAMQHGCLPGCSCEEEPYRRGCTCFRKRGCCMEHCACNCSRAKSAPVIEEYDYINVDTAIRENEGEEEVKNEAKKETFAAPRSNAPAPTSIYSFPCIVQSRSSLLLPPLRLCIQPLSAVKTLVCLDLSCASLPATATVHCAKVISVQCETAQLSCLL
jgi:hypothetical protein